MNYQSGDNLTLWTDVGFQSRGVLSHHFSILLRNKLNLKGVFNFRKYSLTTSYSPVKSEISALIILFFAKFFQGISLLSSFESTLSRNSSLPRLGFFCIMIFQVVNLTFNCFCRFLAVLEIAESSETRCFRLSAVLWHQMKIWGLIDQILRRLLQKNCF